MSFRRVLIANRGEIAIRIIEACRALGIESVVAVSEADKGSLPALRADRSVCIGPPQPLRSYLNRAALLAAAHGLGCDAIHPGYGFLAEDATFSADCETNGIVFIGPSAATIGALGNKLRARAIAERHNVPVVPGSMQFKGTNKAISFAKDIGFPVMIKAAAGGGGRGIRIANDLEELESGLRSAAAEAQAAFGDPALYLERYIPNGRHIEVQIFGDHHGNVIQLGDRDCSLQRRYQKVVEEAPAIFVSEHLRTAIRNCALELAKGVGYRNAGTAEFIYDQDRNDFYFLEMNTRIQVEHPVTEEVTAVDLVRMQLQVAAGEPLAMAQSDVRMVGHAIECRITAESPHSAFRPSPGILSEWQPPAGAGVRLDTHCYPGYRVPPFYDSLLGKLVTHGSDRQEAVQRMTAALQRFKWDGIQTNIPFLIWIMNQPDYQVGQVDTRWIENKWEADPTQVPVFGLHTI